MLISIHDLVSVKMPMDSSRYPDNWSEIAFKVKEKAGWRCSRCDRSCFRPGEIPKKMTRSEWARKTLSVHHSNFNPEDNRIENLIPLCSPCHLGFHAGKKGSISPSQLSLW
jgi:predicted HNH restriction endonuclease